VFQVIVDWVSGSEWSYLIVLGVALLDAFIPVVPSETVAISAGVLAASGDLNVGLVIVAASAGACAGDNVSFGIGTWVGEHTLKRWFGAGKAHRRLLWAEKQLDERGGYLIVIARFIPGGRTATTFVCGYLPTFRWRRFIVFDVLAAAIWGSYTGLLGYFGGKSFEEAPWKGLLLAFAIASGIAVSVEIARHVRQRRRMRVT